MTEPAPATESTGTLPPHRYSPALAEAFESKWQVWWDEQQTYRTPNPGDADFDDSRPRFFCMAMFPYPSGAGLHIGHAANYIPNDIISRYKRMTGHNVLHPIGWDAFGLPAEQYAIATGVHPAETTTASINNFRRQLKRFGFSYDWNREFATMDPDYYRWTQWIWLLAYNAWYDHLQDRARPITELVAMLEAGEASVSEGLEIVQSPPDEDRQAWSNLDHAQRHQAISQRRLAYLSEQTVNWCPKLGTVLANEEVIDGRSERGAHPVVRRPLRQWMFRITAFADRLLKDLEQLDWPESTKIMQAEWIGRSEGAQVRFHLDDDNLREIGPLHVYTTRPDTLFGATFMVVAPEHPLIDHVIMSPLAGTDVEAIRTYVETARNQSDVDRKANTEQKTGLFTGAHAINPATGKRIPIWTADYVLMDYGHGAIMAVPGHDDRDHAFATTFDLPIVEVVQPEEACEGCFTGDGVAMNSCSDCVQLDGLSTADAKVHIIDWLVRDGFGRGMVNYRIRDWLFSRQRYWGEPFPVVFDEHGHDYGVDPSHLPVELPVLQDYQPTESDVPTPMLGKAVDWVATTAGEVGIPATVLPPNTPMRRETNTMPGWAGSCWYYLRYCNPWTDEGPVEPDAESYWLGPTETSPGGVDLYIGGAEHAVLHLLYARFWHKLLFDHGLVTSTEPFHRLVHQGLIISWAYQRANGTLVPVDEVESCGDDNFVETATGETVTQVTAKMSKSLKNVVNPDDVIDEYSCDTFRLYEMYMGPMEANKPWNPRDIVGVYRFLQRLWRLAIDEETGVLRLGEIANETVERRLHRTVEKVGTDIERLAFNTAIAALIEFTNVATGHGALTRDQLDRLTRILAPLVPHIAEELWHRLGHTDSVAIAPWPAVDDAMLRDDTVELPVQIKGKVRSRILVAADADEASIREAALADERIAALLVDATVRKVIVVPGKIVNIITG